jgi:Lipase (class 3)
MDLIQAIQFAQLVNAAYAIPPDDLTNAAGKAINVTYGPSNLKYQVATTIYACDLATDMNPNRGASRVSIGLVLQADSGEVVVALRGTEGVMEWIHDAQFLLNKCPFLEAAGNTEDGFTDMYRSLAAAVDPGSPSLTTALTTLPFKQPVTSVAICGHSLGGALATLFALDIAANTKYNAPIVYTFASPRVGDPTFVSVYNHVVPNTVRIANRVDLVPKLPLPPLYEHVLGLFELNPIILGIPPKILIKPDIPCEHYLSSYLYLLSLQAGGTVLPLETACSP